MSWTGSPSRTICPLNRMCCALESRPPVSSRSSSPARSSTSGCSTWVDRGQSGRSGSTASKA
uniref:Uncharacterized protein n=1 Tax=Anguilla anguilla TaxID=7936 RepID=A0A0E9SH33_ANGAN